MKFITDLSGMVLGRWTVIGHAPKRGNSIYWFCRCSCGTEKSVASSSLLSGRSQSCGCLHSDKTRSNQIRHGHSIGGKLSKTYKSWAAMIQRCTNPLCEQYSDYGGRGITIASELLSFKRFYELMGDRPDGTMIERIDNNGNYEAGNLKWATRIEQNRNQRSNHLITFNNKTQCISAWEEELGFPRSTIHNRLKNGWTVEEALSTKACNAQKMPS